MANAFELSQLPVNTVSAERIAVMLGQLAERVGSTPDDGLAQAIVEAALEMMPKARWSSLTMRRGGRFTSLAVSDDFARNIDAIQYELGSGPCLDSIRHHRTYLVGDLTQDMRWPVYGSKVASAGVRGVLAHRLNLSPDGEPVAALNVYSDHVDAFDEEALWAGAVLSTYGALGVSLTLSHQRGGDLERALASSREIGMAMGILMGRHNLTKEMAFRLLRLASQDSNRKLADIAADIVVTGHLDLPPRVMGQAKNSSPQQ